MKEKYNALGRQTGNLFQKDVSVIIKYSTALMGIAALVILICHSNSYIKFPQSLSKLTIIMGICAQYAVKIFFFLSAIRLFFSMKKDDNIGNFYKKRLIRLLVPYLIISFICLPIKYFVIETNALAFVKDLFLVGYYIDGRSTWFLAAIVPIYLIYPFLYKMRIKYKWFNVVSIAIYFVFALFLKLINPTYFGIVTNAIGGAFAFLLGLVLAPYIYDKKRINIIPLFAALASYFLLFVVFKIGGDPVGNVIVSLLSSSLPIACCYVGALLLDKLPKVINTIFEFFGKCSLELYLLGNVTYIMASFGLKDLVAKVEPNGYLFYFITAVVIVVLAIVISKAVSAINKVIYSKALR